VPEDQRKKLTVVESSDEEEDKEEGDDDESIVDLDEGEEVLVAPERLSIEQLTKTTPVDEIEKRAELHKKKEETK